MTCMILAEGTRRDPAALYAARRTLDLSMIVAILIVSQSYRR